MNILVVAATGEEISPSLAFFQKHNIRYLISGVGMVQTAFKLGSELQQQPAELVLQVGIGGILDPLATLGDIYRITSDEIFDFGAQDQQEFISMESLGFAKGQFAERPPAGFELPSIKTARGITVNTVHGRPDSIGELQQRFHSPIVESMEGAAAFYAAEQTGAAVLQFRAISNYIEPRNRANWLIGPAIHHINDFLQELLEDFV